MAIDDFSAHRSEDSLVLAPACTAVLLIDMLNDFCKPGGAMVLPGYEVLIGPQRAVLDAARASAAAVIHVCDSHRAGLRRDREFAKRTPHCITGSWGARIIDELKPVPGDLVVAKHRYSGFFNTNLDLTLKDMGVDTVIAMGVVTNICVRATVHDAFFHGYHVVVPEDCVAATGPREQESSLYDIGTHFGIVSTAAAVVDGLASGVPLANRIAA